MKNLFRAAQQNSYPWCSICNRLFICIRINVFSHPVQRRRFLPSSSVKWNGMWNQEQALLYKSSGIFFFHWQVWDRSISQSQLRYSDANVCSKSYTHLNIGCIALNAALVRRYALLINQSMKIQCWGSQTLCTPLPSNYDYTASLSWAWRSVPLGCKKVKTSKDCIKSKSDLF